MAEIIPWADFNVRSEELVKEICRFEPHIVAASEYEPVVSFGNYLRSIITGSGLLQPLPVFALTRYGEAGHVVVEVADVRGRRVALCRIYGTGPEFEDVSEALRSRGAEVREFYAYLHGENSQEDTRFAAARVNGPPTFPWQWMNGRKILL